jgi:hypothetical protein
VPTLSVVQKGYGRKMSWLNLRYYPGIFLLWLKNVGCPSQDSRSSGRDSKTGPSEYKTGVLPLRKDIRFKLEEAWEESGWSTF